MLEQMYNFEGIDLDLISLKYLNTGIGSNTNSKFDYVKYRQALKGLQEKNIDLEIAIQSTLTTAETMGINPKDISDSAEKFLNLLINEQTKFDQSLQSQYQVKITDKTEEINNKQKEIENTRKKIEELQKQIQQLEINITEEQKAIEENRSFIENKKNQFHNTVENIKKLVNDDILTLKNKII